MQHKPYWLINVRLEVGYQYDNDIVTGTNTEQFHIRVEDGKIAEMVLADEPIEDHLPKQDAKGCLLLPSFRDMHIHLDKTFYSGPWKAPTVPTQGIFTRLEEEKELLPKMQPFAEDRAKKLIDLLLSAGTTNIRTHCNVGPIEGMKNLEATVRAKEAYKEKANLEIVAFPQQGLLRSGSYSYIREALQNGASIIGGVDPASIDGNIEKSLQQTMELAVENNKGIDLHLHEPGHLGIFTMKRLIALTEEAGWQGRVNISHAYALADISCQEAEEMAVLLAHHGISITSTVPMGKTIPIPLLKEKGVSVSLGDDSIIDHWSPFGKGDSLAKAGRLAERFGLSDERSLGQALGYITGGITSLDEQGEFMWPQPGDAADYVLVDASCTAEAVARRSPRNAVFFKGKIVSEDK
ncbi:amidohydrolase [Virgibacillus salexigens]|uniref:amidohydrolase n=1 Tax=Virgibacillus massiliensis TaxID=1462526 RepID=UPI0013704D6C|nr:amidohydrolase [Virgibacillus massiliensis]MYL42981.1 amidohydrolase family protein [Virgibacillus massiliensis]